jgi:cell wall assembly regulator SMI1
MSKRRKPVAWGEFKAHLKAKGYEVSKTFRKPAKAADLKKLEAAVGFALPEAFRAFYLANDGQSDDEDGLVPAEDQDFGADFFMMPLEEVIGDWEMMNELVEMGEFEGDNKRVRSHKAIRKEWWNAAWLPFATDGGGDYLCLDFAPTKAGRAGQVIAFHHDSPKRELLAPTFEQWLSDLFEEWRDREV